MDLLDRLRPRWRHPDAEVRAAAAREMGPEQQDRLETLARSDPDARVRRIALKKLEDADLLDDLASGDADEALRALAADRARELRISLATSSRSVAEREAALGRLTDERSLVAVAAAGGDDAVVRAALARVTSERALRDVVRTGTHPAVRHAALERITDVALLRGIAVGDGPADLSLAALERIADPDTLHAIADARGASKAVRQRARTMLPGDAVEHPMIGAKEGRARQLALCSAVETLTAEPDVMAAATRVREAEEEWRAIARDVPPKDDVAQRFASACEAILEDAASLMRREVAADHVRLAIEEGLAARRTLCERVEALDGEDARAGLDEARAAWARLAPLTEGRAAGLAGRFARASDACTERYEHWRAARVLHVDLVRVVEDAEALAEADPIAPPKAWQAIERRWTDVQRHGMAADDLGTLVERIAEAGRRLERRRQEADARRGEARQENLTRLSALHARLQELAAAETIRPATARRELAAVDAAIGDLGPLPPSERRAEWTERLGDARDQLLRRVRQVEETEEWRRWANVAAQEEIIRRVEAVLEANDLAEGTRQLGRLQDEWAAVASATPDKSQALWERFRTARNELRRRCDAYMVENLEKKRALCARVADVGEATAWNETAALIKEAQAEWKALGPVPGKHAQALWQQFREPCDRFFARRKAHFEQLDGERREVTQRKIALCERAETLADSTDWEATAAVLKQLQAEWKTSGPLPRAQGEALWQRFRGACDRFFDRRSRREEIAREAALERGRALCDVVDALAARLDDPDASPPELIGKTLDEAWAEWQRLDLGTSDDVRALDARLGAACERIAAARPESLRGTRLDPETTRKRREKLCTRLEDLAGTPRDAPRPQSLQEMALALRERLATNTIAGGGNQAASRRQDVVRELERIEASWATLGPPLDEPARELAVRFETARARVATPSR
jgi:hypothetical protein